MGGEESYARNLGLFTNWLGEPPALATGFVAGLASKDLIGRFIATHLTPIWEAGSVPVLTWLPSTGTTNTTSNRIAREIADGEYDSFIEAWAARLSDWVAEDGTETTRRLYFRPAHEMNGNWFPWSAADSASTTDDYVEMWKHIYTLFRQAGLDAATIQWVWAPNADEIGGVRAEAYYPGDEYVDWVGLDGFNFGDSQSYSTWRSPEDVFEELLGRMRSLTDKPVGLTEVASSSSKNGTYQPAAKAAWIADLFGFVDEHDIRMASWFNVEKSGVDETDWSVFGGQRGTETNTIEDETYNTYNSYRETVNSSLTVRGNADAAPRLTDQQFRGEF